MKRGFSLISMLLAFLIVGVVAAMTLPSFIADIQARHGKIETSSPISRINDTLGTDIKEEGRSKYDMSEIESKTAEYVQKAREEARKNDYNMEY